MPVWSVRNIATDAMVLVIIEEADTAEAAVALASDALKGTIEEEGLAEQRSGLWTPENLVAIEITGAWVVT